MTHLTWLTYATGAGEAKLLECRDALASLLPQPQVPLPQRPSLALFLGRHDKVEVLKHALAIHGPWTRHQEVRFCVGPSQRSLQSPLVLVDGELHDALHDAPGERRASLCENAYPVQRKEFRSTAMRLYAVTLAPFTSVVCLFARDLGGLRGVADLLREWLDGAPPSLEPSQTRPRLLVVNDAGGLSASEFVAQLQRRVVVGSARIKSPPRTSLPDHFSGVEATCTASPGDVMDRLVLLTQDAATRRGSVGRLPAVHHLGAFLTAAVRHVAEGVGKAFQPIHATRRGKADLSPLSSHIAELSRVLSTRQMRGAAVYPVLAQWVASALMLDSCPPNTHFFPHREVFDEFYYQPCVAAASGLSVYPNTRADFIEEVRDEFEAVYFAVTAAPTVCTAKQTHLYRLADLHRQHNLSAVYTSVTCLCCLLRPCECILSCGHGICECCVVLLGAGSATVRHRYRVNSCPICVAVNTRRPYVLVPPTAGMRVLSIDGGGVRGAIPLTVLTALEDALGELACPASCFFDLVCGTSSGGLIALGIGVERWTARQCLQQFEELSRTIFRRRTSGSMLFARVQSLVMSYVADSKYEATQIEHALERAFGSALLLLGAGDGSCKVAVTATTAREALPCLLTSYNGPVRDVGYQFVRAKDPALDVSVAEAARCTSAAPWFFSSKSLRHLGTFQDGGLRHNNPFGVALRESRALKPGLAQPDFALSLGTGVTATQASSASSSPIRDGFLTRLFRSFMSSMDGEKAWAELLETVHPEARVRYHRINLELTGKEPDIDDVSRISELKERTVNDLDILRQLLFVRDSIWASSFYLELDSLPICEPERIRCSGHIYCRLQLSTQGRRALYKALYRSEAEFVVNGESRRCVKHVPEQNPPFSWPIKLSMPQRNSPIEITLRRITMRPRAISGMPTTLATLIEAQNLDAPFGRPDHGVPEKPLPPLPRRKRKAHYEDAQARS